MHFHYEKGDKHFVHEPDTGNISVAFFLNAGFTIIEIIGGFLTGSLAILSDALHDLGDTLSLGLAWYFQKLSGKESDARFTYGYGRFSLLGAIINAIILFAGSLFLIYNALPRLWNPTDPHTEGMFLLAILGVVVNGAAVLKLRKGTTMNEKVVALHLFEDVLGWVAVLIGSLLIHFFGWTIIDPILSLLIALYILLNVFKNLRQSFKIILQATPSNVNIDRLSTRLNEIEGIEEAHHLHVWTLDGEFNIMTIHVRCLKGMNDQDAKNLKKSIRQTARDEGVNHVTIELEL
jgi:cobalt-zinc-cadmium efflux system protein